ncbi:MAG: PqqD family protein [Casimicrobiaceae bacterium]
MDWDVRPRQAPGIEIREAPDGLVVYDAGRDRLHYLNPSAALLLENCDGSLRAGELPDLLATAFALDAPPAGEVEQCLDRLFAEGLLVAAPPV